ncbi:uncharacterized protein LOC143628052 [Bidens hawaiensis]|uniref:uncharacterized protein LOC143628052 n=1 Tax=Bidens hawaiensis TaxID=980011 RepID=UPI00404A69B8
MQQRNPGNRRPTGTDGSDFSYRMVVDNRYTKVAKGKSTLSKILVIQAVVLLVGVLDMLFAYVNKEPLETLGLVCSSVTAISIIVGEIGRKRSRVNFLRFYIAASSIGVLGSVASVIQNSIQLKAIHDPSNWEIEKVALLRIAGV